VVGCDRSRNNPFSRAAGRQVSPPFPDRKRFLICDGRTVPPTDELCNGLDDDCDGALPGEGRAEPLAAGDEIDRDKDGYLPCTGCDRLTLPMGLVGCRDCNDLSAAIRPGAPELCDGKDNACVMGPYTDGKDDCKVGDKTACCPGTPMCLDPLTTFAHCGGCMKACSLRTASRCDMGQCLCGMLPACSGMAPICKDGTTCVECLEDRDCPMDRPRCNMMNQCVM
jgi:hypothetical protein